MLANALYVIGCVAIINSIQAYVPALNVVKRVYGNVPSEVSPLTGRLFGTWTLTSGIIRIYASYHINDQSAYELAMITYIIAFLNFTSEAFLYRSTKWNSPGCLPALCISSYEVDPLNTVQLSNHVLYKSCKGMAFDEKHMEDIFQSLLENKFYLQYSHILTGYCGNPKALAMIYKYVQIFKSLNDKILITIDPVLGDNGRLYVPAELIPIYKDSLCSLADIITPNGYEAEILTGIKPTFDNIEEVLDALHDIGPKTVFITSVLIGEFLYLFGSNKDIKFQIKIVPKTISFSGTGDVFSSLITAYITELADIKKACETTVDTLQAILEKTIEVRKDSYELALIQSRDDILNPPTMHVATQINQK
ncbi:hypothetical protein HDV02_003242, partial [Globomyces sp. JEL0801]